jgi:hypothetical protein
MRTIPSPAQLDLIAKEELEEVPGHHHECQQTNGNKGNHDENVSHWDACFLIDKGPAKDSVHNENERIHLGLFEVGLVFLGKVANDRNKILEELSHHNRKEDPQSQFVKDLPAVDRGVVKINYV